jgi:alpha-ketoglutarate-dependent taurine dioxygenase
MMADLSIAPLVAGKRAPLCVTLARGDTSLPEFVASNLEFLTSSLLRHGAILFRGFEVDDAQKFATFVAATGGRSTYYRFGSTPRKLVTGQIYTSTEYPAQREIPLHSENAYHTVWPRRLAFCCLVPAASGGETPIADLQDVSRSIGVQLLERLESAQVQYVRHFHEGIDLSWREVFQTADRDELARICAANGIRHEWLGPAGQPLRTVQVCQGVIRHPLTAERLFFNQAHLFHATSLGAAVAATMREALGPDRLPRHARYGDGSEIADEDIARIHEAFRANSLAVTWRRGDVLWIDNTQVAHGRRPFQGPRTVLAALLDSSDES